MPFSILESPWPPPQGKLDKRPQTMPAISLWPVGSKKSDTCSSAPQKINGISAQQYWQRTTESSLMETATETVKIIRSDELFPWRLPKDYQVWILPWVYTTPFSFKHSKKGIIEGINIAAFTKKLPFLRFWILLFYLFLCGNRCVYISYNSDSVFKVTDSETVTEMGNGIFVCV